jgi:hypothetical protein
MTPFFKSMSIERGLRKRARQLQTVYRFLSFGLFPITWGICFSLES